VQVFSSVRCIIKVNVVGQVYAHKETTSEETTVEKHLKRGLGKVGIDKKATPEVAEAAPTLRPPRLELVWGGTLHHIDDLPFSPNQLPDVYTQFRKVKSADYSESLSI
jgi:deoxyribodipyrimidine photo-lyase